MHHSISIRQSIGLSVCQFISPSVTPWISTWISANGSWEESQLSSDLVIIQSFHHHHEDASLTLWALLYSGRLGATCSMYGPVGRETRPNVWGPRYPGCWNWDSRFHSVEKQMNIFFYLPANSNFLRRFVQKHFPLLWFNSKRSNVEKRSLNLKFMRRKEMVLFFFFGM